MQAKGGILLSGASGMLGSALHRAFSACQMPAIQLARSSASRSAAAVPRPSSLSAVRSAALSLSREVSWNPSATPAVTHPELLEGLAAAIHLSGAGVAAHRWTPSYKRILVSSRVDTTRALATTLAGLRHPPAALFVASATGIYGDRGDELLDESSAAGSGFLADLCREWEAAAQPAVDAGIRVIHLRFGVVLAPHSSPGALARMIPLFRIGLGGPLGSGRQWVSWISLPDVVSAVLFLLDHPSISGPVNLTAPTPVTNAQFSRAVARQLRRPAFLPTPPYLLRIALGEIADGALLASARAFPSKLNAAGFSFSHPTIDIALAAVLARS